MLRHTLKRGTAVIWTRRKENRGSIKMVMGIVQASPDADMVMIEVVEPDEKGIVIVTVPMHQLRHF